MRRIMLEKLVQHLPKKEFTILIGAKQTGKSTLLKQLEKHCMTENIPLVFSILNLKNCLISFIARNSFCITSYFSCVYTNVTY